jgi:hypothetical protein
MTTDEKTAMTAVRQSLSDERGAVLVHVAIAILALIAFSALAVDYGTLLVSRRQAQNAADGAALAGALSLAFDDPDDIPRAQATAAAVGVTNQVWGAAPSIVPATDVQLIPCPPLTPGVPDTCIRANVYRSVARSNPLPTFFAQIMGITSQDVRATATAQVATGNTTDCLKPWAIIDRWDEFDPAGAEPDFPNPDPDFLPTSTFDKYSTGLGQAPPQENDLFVPPSAAGPGTGFRLPDDYGRRFTVKVTTNENATVSPGWFRAIRIPRLDGMNGGNVYKDNITSCGGLPSSFAIPGTTQPCPANIGNDDAAYWATQGCFGTEPGNKIGPTRQGIDELIARDPTATWDSGAQAVTNSAFGPTSSPRIVPIGLLDVDNFLSQDPSGANGVLRLVNIFGFFVEGMGDVDPDTGAITVNTGGNAVIGRLMTIPATKSVGSGSLAESASFMRTVLLVR